MNHRKNRVISRREFARRAAIASAATIVPGTVLTQPNLATAETVQSDEPKLSPEGKAEAEARIQAILGQYGSRLSDNQKSEIRRLCYAAQPPLDRLRAYAISNADSPALYLKPLVEREKKPAPSPLPKLAGAERKG